MRSPEAVLAPSEVPAGIVVGTAIALVMLLGVASLLLYSHAVPPVVLDGLTSPASFGARTT